MKYYMAYGSNLNILQMARRCPGAVPVGGAILYDYKLVFRRMYLTIEPDDGSMVPVGIWEIDKKNEEELDRYEGYPHFYRKELIPVSFRAYSGAMHEDAQCLVYIMNDGFPIQQATPGYLKTVSDGYKDFGFSIVPLMHADMEAAKA